MSQEQGESAAAWLFQSRVQAGLIAARLEAGGLEVMQFAADDGFVVRVSSPDMSCDMTARQDQIWAGWGPEPAPGYAPPAELAVRVAAGVASILHAPGAVSPGAITAQAYNPLYTAAGTALRDAGLRVRLSPQVHADDLEVIVSLDIDNAAMPDRGKVTLHEDGSMEWTWRYPPGASQDDIAGRAAAFIHGLLPAEPLAA